ncbi:uncharacterized protein LOC127796435 [Diospyros lotus]|uniref:uncharacterized protein LOC127796435 n=1 Tax=Diospyros lotus TaxID=55363 RepID=UPI002254408E|nr:uncharacterized protein LOC127796435 [Diospyros lotus]
MALRMAMLKGAMEDMAYALGLRRWAHAIAQPAPIDASISHPPLSTPLVLPEFHRDSITNKNYESDVSFQFPSFSLGCGGGSMELMAVPKKKVSPHKRGIRNGPRALKPIPVIIRCKSCGRVKLPHFFCCSGDRGNTGERSSSSG